VVYPCCARTNFSGSFGGCVNAFFIQNEWVRNGFFVQVARWEFWASKLSTRVIHNVGNFDSKKIALKINDLRKLSTFGGKLTLKTVREALLSLPLLTSTFTPPLPQDRPFAHVEIS
jgi:hypothetical protein